MQKKFSFFGSQDLFFAHMLMMMLALDHGLLGMMWSTLMKVSFADKIAFCPFRAN